VGAIFRPKYKGSDGVVRESAIWWVRFRQHGKTVRQSTETADERKAKAFLREREGKVALDIPVSPKGDRLTLDDAAKMMRDDYTANGRKSSATLEYPLAHVLAHFGGTRRLGRITTGDVERYKAARLDAGAARATVNRELAALRRMGSLARHEYGLIVPFDVKTYQERNARKGFFERDDLEAVCKHLPDALAALARAAYITGWRKSELRSRQWSHVDVAAGWIRLEPGETKNDEGRQFPLTPELRALLEAQRARVQAIERKTKRIVPWIFARDDGAPVGDFRKAWASACVAAGFFRVEPIGEAKDGEAPKTRKVPTKLVHDFRRSAVRNLIRAGIPETTAMAMTGHRTREVFKRYAIVDEGMLREAGAKLAAAAAIQGTAEEAPRGRVIELRG
jgi:integrase